MQRSCNLSPYIYECALINIILGLSAVALITRTETGERLFYDGPREEEEDKGLVGIVIAMLWVFPFILLLWGLIWGVLGLFLKEFK